MKGGVIILLFFVLGVVCGKYHLVPSFLGLDTTSYAVLCVLILCVGVSIGSDRDTLRRFRTFNPTVALLPVCSLLGTLAGSLVVWCLLDGYSLSEWMAVGSGMGYYSLSSVLITGYRGAELGSIALLSNIVREVIVLIGAPLLVRLFGSLSPIAAAGATAIDTTLPIISKACGSQWVPVSIYCGMVTDFCVPFLVTFFCLL